MKKWKERAGERSDEIERLHRIIGEHDDWISRLKAQVKELEHEVAGWKKVVDRQEGTLQLRQNLINQREGERDEYKDMCEEYEGEVADLGNKIDQLEADLLTMAEVKDEELRKVVDREHAIHNEAAAGMIAKVKELEDRRDHLIEKVKGLQKTLDLAASNEQVWVKQLAERYLVINQKTERIEELQQANSKLILDLEYAEMLVKQHEEAAKNGDRAHLASLEQDISEVLNYWGMDTRLGMADFIIAELIDNVLAALEIAGKRSASHGVPPTHVVTDARLAHISIDDDGLGTIEVKE